MNFPKSRDPNWASLSRGSRPRVPHPVETPVDTLRFGAQTSVLIHMFLPREPNGKKRARHGGLEPLVAQPFAVRDAMRRFPVSNEPRNGQNYPCALVSEFGLQSGGEGAERRCAPPATLSGSPRAKKKRDILFAVSL